MKAYSSPTMGYYSLELQERIANACGPGLGFVEEITPNCAEMPVTETNPPIDCCGPYELS